MSYASSSACFSSTSLFDVKKKQETSQTLALMMDAPIVYRDCNAILKFDVNTSMVTIVSGADQTGKNKVVLQIAVNDLINIESAEERHKRQQARIRENCFNDNTLRNAEAVTDDDNVGCFSRKSTSPISPKHEDVFHIAEDGQSPVSSATPQPFFMHFVTPQQKIHSLIFYTRSGQEQQKLANAVIQSILQSVYRHGTKHLVVFVSPVSGSGKAKIMWENDVSPILYLSKHHLQVIVTQRQAHCEDHIADVANTLGRGHVVVAVGGDGMLHEAVNGLQRRREALAARHVDEEADGIPLLATIPAGSGCALAKCFNIIVAADAARALVHLNSTGIDLLQIAYIPCMHNFVPTDSEKREYKKKKQPIPAPRREMTTCTMPPRYAFLNCCFAITNEIDRESEHWRWMGNARFTVKAMQLLASGIPLYRCEVKYLPWKHVQTGDKIEKMSEQGSDMLKRFPRCTGRDDCEHCTVHRRKRSREETATGVSSEGTPMSGQQQPPSGFTPLDSPDWIHLPEDRFALLMLNNLVDAARDMAIAPLAHVGDGSIDVVYNGKCPGDADGISRADFVKVFMGLEGGTHIKEPSIRYIKAREVVVLPEDGTVMADGEVLPTSGVHVRTLPNAVRIVRSL